MSRPVINCVKCEGFMEEGFIIERGDSNVGMVSTWVEGAPVKSFWSGVKVKDKQQFYVATYRCAGCGYLESYAIELRENQIFS